MLESLIIAFREGLEASLIVGVIIGYLTKTRQTQYNSAVYWGVATAVLGSIMFGIILALTMGGLEGRGEQIFEGFTMIITAAFLTFLVAWVLRNKNISVTLEEKVDTSIKRSYRLGLFFTVFVAIIREGIELVLFTQSLSMKKETSLVVLGTLAGLAIAIGLGYLIYIGALNVRLNFFFNATGVFLIFVAAGLLAHGVHELQEAHFLPIFQEQIWDINPVYSEGQSPPLLHEKGYIGSILKTLFGYNGDPTLLEFLSYIGYLGTTGFLWFKTKQ